MVCNVPKNIESGQEPKLLVLVRKRGDTVIIIFFVHLLCDNPYNKEAI